MGLHSFFFVSFYDLHVHCTRCRKIVKKRGAQMVSKRKSESPLRLIFLAMPPSPPPGSATTTTTSSSLQPRGRDGVSWCNVRWRPPLPLPLPDRTPLLVQHDFSKLAKHSPVLAHPLLLLFTFLSGSVAPPGLSQLRQNPPPPATLTLPSSLSFSFFSLPPPLYFFFFQFSDSVLLQQKKTRTKKNKQTKMKKMKKKKE